MPEVCIESALSRAVAALTKFAELAILKCDQKNQRAAAHQLIGIAESIEDDIEMIWTDDDGGAKQTAPGPA